MENTYSETGTIALNLGAGARDVGHAGHASHARHRPSDEARHELMAPGHLYNLRTRTGIKWLAPDPQTGEPGSVQLWSRGWDGEVTLLGEARHRSSSAWDYWYNLEFANSFPEVTHWWFGDAWTGTVRLWRPEGAGRDPESSAEALGGWMRFGPPDPDDEDAGNFARPLPWTVVLTDPVRVSAPLPPMFANVVNLPLQLLVAETLVELLRELVMQPGPRSHSADGISPGAPEHVEAVLTSLVRREDLPVAFPTEFAPWRLDRLPDLTPREALCRVQGLEPR